MKTNKKIMAAVIVFAMLAISIVPLADAMVSDAASGDGQTYSYTIVYDASVMETGTDSLTLADMEAIFHPAYDSTSVTDENNGTTGYGDWTWNLETGVGPFNSFYAAFDIDDNNRMIARLNPFDLTKTIDGYDLYSLPNDHRYNVMWVLPTVYWHIGETTIEETTYPTITLTNDSSAGGIAYAHTINGHVYNYVAYGVYEGYNDTIDADGTSTTVLTSQTGKTPTANVTRNNFRTYAHNYSMDSNLGENAYSMLWNFYQWELYKYCALGMMEDFNSQYVTGVGKVVRASNDAPIPNDTGALDQSGPYAGTPLETPTTAISATNGSDSVKIFIENAWGSVWDFVDGVVFNYTELYNSNNPESATTVDIYIESVDTPTNTIDATQQYVDKIELSSRYDPQEADLSQLSPAVINPGNLNPGSTQTMDANPVLNSDEPEDPSLTTSAYPLDIITNDARIWGFGDVPGGSASTGMSDFEWLPNSIGAKLLGVGGNSYTGSSSWPQCGLSAAASNGGLDYRPAYVGARLAFVFDDDSSSNATTVSFTNYPNGYGTVEDVTGTVTAISVPKGSVITYEENSNEMQIAYKTVTATPTAANAQYTYSFSEWSKDSGFVVNNNTTIQAEYDRVVNSYTITWDVDGVTDTTTVAYGKMPTHDKPTKDYYTFAGWSPALAKVTGDATYTATWTAIEYTVTWDPTGGSTPVKTSKGSIDTAITEYPTPTRDNFTFAGWFTAIEGGEQIAASINPTANVTYYAHWTPITYTVTYNAGAGTGGVASATGSQMSPISLTTATAPSSTYFNGWFDAATGGKLVGFNGTLYYPSADTTLYAQYVDTPVYNYSLNFNANGGYSAPKATLKQDDESGALKLQVPNAEPKRAGQYFQGWATNDSATEAEYGSGDWIEVSPGSSVTLYAVWGDSPAPGPYSEFGNIIIVLMLVGLIVGLVAVMFKAKSGTMNMKDFIMIIIGATVAIIIIVFVTVPILGSM